MKNFDDVTSFVKTSALTAVDCEKDYGGLEKSIASHRVNVRDTLNEYGIAHFYNDAVALYDKEIDALTGHEYQFTTLEAVAFVKRQPAGTRFNLAVRLDAPVAGTENEVFRSGCSTYLRLSRNDALDLALSMLSHTLEARGGRIPMRSYYSSIGTTTRKVVWLG
jgi:hypothetical protein